jgi:ubiquinone/menaquinone biosynthesis C-methylase UbiE
VRALRPAAFAFGRWNRRRKAAFALDLARRRGVGSVLLVGVAGTRNPVNNLVEQTLVDRLPFVVASGLDTDAAGWAYYVCADGLHLPFASGSFDLVYANAVLEHVGDRAEQATFVSEAARVGRNWVLTTPNRTFPIEAHHHTLITHWRRGWSRGTVTRLLSRKDLQRLAPHGRVRGIPFLSPTLAVIGTTASHGGPDDLQPDRQS